MQTSPEMPERDNIAPVLLDRRNAGRNNVDLKALGMFVDLEDAFECRILDLSKTGARLGIGASDIMPNRFKLLVAEEKRLYECETVWRSDQEIGVRFKSKIEVQC